MSNNKRGLIELCGEDSRKFLQGQVSCDMDSLSVGQMIRGCHCTPKGRVIFMFTALMRNEHSIILETHPSIVNTAIASLSKYAVFFKTEISDISEQDISVEPQKTNLERLKSGVADIGIETTELFIPQMLNLDILGYISFKKGCYTGQEVVARAHYLGAVKRKMYLLSLSTSSVPSAGCVVVDDNSHQIGNVVNAEAITDNSVEALVVLSSKGLECEHLVIDGGHVAFSQLPSPYPCEPQ